MKKDKAKTDAILAEAREFYQSVLDFEGIDRDKAIEELKFLCGEQWDARAKQTRELEGRPCLTINTLPTFLHQITNDARQNRTSIKVHPVSDGADSEKAEILQGLVRHIEYASNAEPAYDTALEYAASIGRGYWRLVTGYCGGDTFDQEIRFERIRNPFTVYFDPGSKEPDGSDAMRVMISSQMPRKEFERKFPKAEATEQSLVQGKGDIQTHWCNKDWVRVAHFYKVEEEEAKLVRVNGQAKFADELEPGEIPETDETGKTIERDGYRRKVMLRLITAVDVLQETEIPCKWIPVFPVWGAEVDVDGEVQRSGIIRNAKDPAKAYNFWYTSATERIALEPKVPFIGAEGQFEGYEKDWKQANTRSFAYLQYKPVTVSGQLAPPPQRAQMSGVPAGELQMMMHSRDNIKATTSIFDASLGAQGNETSGRAILARQREGDVANFHFVDNLRRAQAHCGRCLVYMIPKIYDTERVIRILGEDDEPESVAINQQLPQPYIDADTQKIVSVLNDITVGKYDVTVKAGPAYSTIRQEAAEAMTQFGQSWPRLMEIAGDKVVRAMDWPGAEEIAERIKRTIPPEIRGGEEETDGPMVQTPQGPIPAEQAGMLIQQMMQQLQQLDQVQGMLEQQMGALNQQLADAQAQLKSKDAETEIKRTEADTKEFEAQTRRIDAIVSAIPLMAGKPEGEPQGPDVQESMAAVMDAINQANAVIQAQIAAVGQEQANLRDGITQALLAAKTMPKTVTKEIGPDGNVRFVMLPGVQ